LVVPADAPCEADEIRTCAGPLTTLCVTVGTPLCGGPADSGGPGVGDACGACNDGVWQCDAAGEPTCVGATEPNACGGCGTLPAMPGSACGEGRAWTCEGGEPRCARAPGLNRCGGAGVLDGVPGESCGACGTGLVACISTDLTACLQQGLTARNACGGCRALPGLPGEACGVCDSGVWQCDGDDALTCVGEYADARFELFADRDGDGFGDPAVVEAQCPGTPGWALNPDDCDDTDALRQPGAPERCNERDDDCDGDLDEGFEAWRDGDGDGYGNPAMPRTMCTLEPGYVRNVDDCDDERGNTRPGAPWASTPRRDGSWDRDCDGVVSFRHRGEARCTTVGVCDETGGDDRNHGWAGEVAACGETALWLFTCVLDATGGCIPTGELRTQLCR
jgi:hypothetical protein